MLRKIAPYALGVALISVALAGISLIVFPAHSSKHTSRTSVSSATTESPVDIGFRFANALNAQPPTTNKLIGEVACQKQGNDYVCIFIGNSSGTLYCAAYAFTLSSSGKLHIVNFKKVTNSYCGL